jgi:hypothetical protein
MIRITVTKAELWVLIYALSLLNKSYPSTNSVHDRLEEELKSIYKEVS